jgi:imidazoleglycerol-phosphate dehydratase
VRYARGTVTAADRTQDARTQVRVTVDGSGAVNVATGVSVLDHLLGLLAAYASFDVALEVAPGDAEDEVRAAGRAFGEALAEPLRGEGLRGHGSAVVPSAEALAHVTLEASDQPLLVSHVDLSGARVGGMATDVVAAFLQEFVTGASLTLHVRLIDGSDPHHVLEAIFKALGTALAQAVRPRRRQDEPHD